MGQPTDRSAILFWADHFFGRKGGERKRTRGLCCPSARLCGVGRRPSGAIPRVPRASRFVIVLFLSSSPAANAAPYRASECPPRGRLAKRRNRGQPLRRWKKQIVRRSSARVHKYLKKILILPSTEQQSAIKVRRAVSWGSQDSENNRFEIYKDWRRVTRTFFRTKRGGWARPKASLPSRFSCARAV